ncbi:MAG: 2-C-methyl-D-erythritol 2,4-cyclodiphosphate synthase [Candidatus Marsarchaeota archaeon]|nr:2-C-methyl-D-erythritol 2,4-cyclodiphosphate synthase [Candidatus Marsarchaeota archaeon]
MPVGLGYDIHKLVENKKLILGGIEINFPKGLIGDNDADVLIHPIIDAILGAAGFGDIDRYFPKSDPNYDGLKSVDLLRYTVDLIYGYAWTITNVDITYVAKEPRIIEYSNDIRRMLASAMNITISKINIKDKTNHNIGPTGNGEAIAVFAIVQIDKAL